MYGNEIWTILPSIIGLVGLVLYSISLFILRYVFKIKRDYKIEGKVHKNLPKIFNICFIILIILSGIASLVWSINFLLLVLFIEQLIVSKLALNMLEDKKQKYYQYANLVFNSIFIVFISLISVTNLIK